MEENPKEEKKARSNKLFIFGAIALVVVLFVLSIVEIIFINSQNEKIKKQQQEISELNNTINYYKDQSHEDYFEGTGAQE